MKRITLLIGMVIILFGCSENTQSEKDNSALRIYTTLYPLAFFAEEIGGDDVSVESILPPGADPHNFEPTSRTMVEIAEADIFLYNGANLETYAEKIKESLIEEDVLMVEASEGISLDSHSHHEENHSEDEGHHHGDYDPHIWLDPLRSIEIAENIKEALVTLQPEQADLCEDNFLRLEEQLVALDKNFHDSIEAAPVKDILVTHAAYGYWEQRYGLEQVAVAGVSPSQEPSQKQLEEIIKYVEENDKQYLLFEQNIEPKVAEVIQQETGVTSLELHNLSTLTEEDISNNETYFTLMEKNLDVLMTALDE